MDNPDLIKKYEDELRQFADRMLKDGIRREVILHIFQVMIDILGVLKPA